MPLKRHVTFWCALATTFGVKQKSLVRVQRANVEFFYKVLPNLGKDLDRGLLGQFVLTAPLKKQRNSALPSFLYELFILIFNKDGELRYENIEKIQELRQLLMMYYKFVVPFTPEQIQAATEKFVVTDSLVKQHDYPFGLNDVRLYMTSLFPGDPMDIRGHHSNGATADRYRNVQKREIRRYIPSLMKIYDAHYFFNTQHHVNTWCEINRTITAEPAARLGFVPKDSRGPRVICMEPHERMFIQKGLQTLLYDHIENYSPAKGYINFSDQSINQRLAYKASIDSSYATIDLKDASDLVPWNLLKYLVPSQWYCALKSTRSSCVDLPNGQSLTINKYASMGSALCFPIEAMVFWSIVKTVSPEVYVYGDDIIVPTEFAVTSIKALESYGLIVNKDKTLITGNFRESCGAEFFNGHDISYVKCKSYDELEFTSFCNEITKKFGVDRSDVLIKLYEDIVGPIFRLPIEELLYPEPFVYYTNRSLHSNDVFFKRRYNVNLQRYEYRRRIPKLSTSTYTHRCDHDLLFDWFTVKDSVTPKTDRFWKHICVDLPLQATYVIRKKRIRIYGVGSLTNHGEVSLHTNLKYTWV